MKRTYLERLDEIPPALCRFIARTNSRRPRILTILEIAAAAGLHWRKVAWIASLKSFAKVTVEDADKFRAGCGINRLNEKRHRDFIRRNHQRHRVRRWDHLQIAKSDLPKPARAKFFRRILKRL